MRNWKAEADIFDWRKMRCGDSEEMTSQFIEPVGYQSLDMRRLREHNMDAKKVNEDIF